jgi:hypothetical protein
MIPIGPSEPPLPLRRIFPLAAKVPDEIVERLDRIAKARLRRG